MGELIVKKESALQIAKRIGTQSAIKPLEKEVFLQDVFVRDILFHSEKLIGLKIGRALQLKREPQPYDELIVAVFDDNNRLGELAEFDEAVFARLLDAGKKLTAKVKNVVISPEYNSLQISISMVDF